VHNSIEENNKIIDGIIGFAIGDALGVPAEFQSREYLKRVPVTDMQGYGSHKVPLGTWSDDTSMTIATMDSIIECGEINYSDIMKKFHEWESSSKYTATGVFFDIGISTRKAIYNYTKGITPTKCGGISYGDNGNGSLMRILPIVLYSYSQNLNFEEEVELINNLSSLTHGHEISRLGCKIYSDYVKELLDGKTKEEAYANLKFFDYTKYYSLESIGKYKRILDGSIAKTGEHDIRSSGYVVDTLEASIWCVLNSSAYDEAVLKAVNLGNDTDTVAAITGSMAGLIYTYKNIPNRWKENLKSNEYLMKLCNDFNKMLLKLKKDSKIK